MNGITIDISVYENKKNPYIADKKSNMPLSPVYELADTFTGFFKYIA